MRIGVIATSYPRFAGDPAGSFVAGHVEAMRAVGHDVEVIAAGDGRTDRGGESRLQRIPSQLFYRGGAPDALEAGHSLGAAAAFSVRLCARVVGCARRWNLIVAHWLAPCALAALPSRLPLLAIAHGGDVHTLARLRLLGPTLALLRARRAKLAFVSADLLDLARRHGRIDDDDAIVQAMGVDVGHFATLEHAPTTPPTVLVIARLVPVKGVDVAMAAMRKLRNEAQLIVIGDGPERATLARACAGFDRVALMGTACAAERDHWLRRASVVVVPSRVLANGRTEGSPLVALEALAAGIPVVASAVGGLRQLSGITTVPPDDPLALAAAIDSALTAPSSPARQRASVECYAWPAVMARLMTHACVAGFAPSYV